MPPTVHSIHSQWGNGHQSALMAAVTSAITRWTGERRSDQRGQVRDISLRSETGAEKGSEGSRLQADAGWTALCGADEAGSVGWGHS